MNHSMRMQILYSLNDLVDKVFGLKLSNSLSSLEQITESLKWVKNLLKACKFKAKCKRILGLRRNAQSSRCVNDEGICEFWFMIEVSTWPFL